MQGKEEISTKKQNPKQFVSKSLVTNNLLHKKMEEEENDQEIEYQDEKVVVRKVTAGSVTGDPREWLSNYLGRSNTNDFEDLKQKYLLRLGIIEETSVEAQSTINPYQEEAKTATIQEEKEQEEKQEQIERKMTVINNDEKKKSFAPESIRQGYVDKTGYQFDYLMKTDDQVREQYLQKLINNKILKTSPSKKQQSNDTLLCTTYLGSMGFVDLEQEVWDLLVPLDNTVSTLLKKCCDYGEVYIITNAAAGWVEYSSKFFLPFSHDVLNQMNIQVISARSGYESLFPNDTTKWKIEAFLKLKEKYDYSIITNIICIGDSIIEIDAAHILGKQFKQALIKTIKFRENPRPDELVKQQELVFEKLDQIYSSIKNLTIRLEKKQTN